MTFESFDQEVYRALREENEILNSAVLWGLHSTVRYTGTDTSPGIQGFNKLGIQHKDVKSSSRVRQGSGN